MLGLSRLIPPLMLARLRLAFRSQYWRLLAKEHCSSCDHDSLILFSERQNQGLLDMMKDWDCSEAARLECLRRENGFCCHCGASNRVRAQAKVVLDTLGIDSVSAAQLDILECAEYNVFRSSHAKTNPRYVVSEYMPDMSGEFVKPGVRNENLEKLSFADNSFDLVLTSDVLEHVDSLESVAGEIRRILKPGGLHIFTVPVDSFLTNTRERLAIHLPAIYHGDTVRTEGCLVARDFGGDIAILFANDNDTCRTVEVQRENNTHDLVYVVKTSQPTEAAAQV